MQIFEYYQMNKIMRAVFLPLSYCKIMFCQLTRR